MQRVSCFQVFKNLCCAPRNENVFWSIFKPTLYGIGILISLGALYLWCVPLTNVMGQVLFADFKCYPSNDVWGACGRITGSRIGIYQFDRNGSDVSVGFLIFLMIQSSLGALLLAAILYGYSRYYGVLYDYPKFLYTDCCFDTCVSCCSDSSEREHFWYPNSGLEHTDATCFGACLQINSINIAIVGIFFLTIYVGIWGGRAIAMQVHPACMPYQNTQLGFYGCVAFDGSYVGGETCKNCAGIGFAILGLPLFSLHLLVPLLWICLRTISRAYRRTKQHLEDQVQAVHKEIEHVAQNEVPILPISDTIQDAPPYSECCKGALAPL